MFSLPKILLPIAFALFLCTNLHAQTCTGALGDPIPDVGTDFGRGQATFGPPITETNYTYTASSPTDGSYTVVKTTQGLNPGWHQDVVNHTARDPDGYFMVVNASNAKGIFYQKEITNKLCPNTIYEFAAYVINLLRNPGKKPKILFTITNDDVEIASFNTGDIPEGTANDWIKRGGTFVTPTNLGVIKLTMTNENDGGNGNDLAIDDITFRACGPIIPTAINNDKSTVGLCVGSDATYVLSATVNYADPMYQWQRFNGTAWEDIIGQDKATMDLTIVGAVEGTYRYRISTSERTVFSSPNCRVASQELTVIVTAKPQPLRLRDGAVCENGDVALSGSTDFFPDYSYSWTGPNNFKSSQVNPIVYNIKPENEGIYSVTITNAGGCSITLTTDIKVQAPLLVNTNISAKTICEGDKVQLIADGGTIYKWSPADGLSNPDIANPIAAPTQTTTYRVDISTINGSCKDSRDVAITVQKKPSADAGKDKNILLGQSVELKGNPNGNYKKAYWTPAAYLDDPNKLNPIATPLTSTVYTLHVEGLCNDSNDQMMVKVYPEVEIKNAFTPNGDGINDTWTIPSIDAFPNPSLKITNRFGHLVFESSRSVEWDGKLHGKDLPSGTYYYTLYINNNYKLYSGWILLTR